MLISERKRVRRRALPVAEKSRAKMAAATLALVLLATVGSARAASPGLEAYRNEEFGKAYQQFQQTLQQHPDTRATDKIQFDAGAAAYKMKDYAKALQSFSQALLSPSPQLQSRSHYNLGNTLYQRGEEQKKPEREIAGLEQRAPTLRADAEARTREQRGERKSRICEEQDRGAEETAGTTAEPDAVALPESAEQERSEKRERREQGQREERPEAGESFRRTGRTRSPKQSRRSPRTKRAKTSSNSPAKAKRLPPRPQRISNRKAAPPLPRRAKPPVLPLASPGEDTVPSPSPGKEGKSGSPTPAPGEGDQEQSPTSSPTPGATPLETPSKQQGEVKGAGDDKPAEEAAGAAERKANRHRTAR